ncbi:MAG: Pirin domain protein [Rhizobacter sp.]|nr:Pirin domain protein [Rhizobacter sp.]
MQSHTVTANRLSESFKDAFATPTSVLATTPARRIVHRTRGQSHGPITRLMSPSDLGQRLKPFVFLDLFDSGAAPASGFGMHPHSGIATLTWIMEGSISYEDTSGASGVLPQGGVEWMQAGGGAWHSGGFADAGRVRGFQLWVALPSALELGPATSHYLAPEAIERDGPVRVLLGSHGTARSRIEAPSPMNYLSVRLKAGERWRYEPPMGHDVAWIALGEGSLLAPDRLSVGEMAVFEESQDAIDFQAETDTEFVLGSAVKHPHDLVLGRYSVHTAADTLRHGEARIREIGMRLRSEGRLG